MDGLREAKRVLMRLLPYAQRVVDVCYVPRQGTTIYSPSPYLIPQLGPYLNPYLYCHGKVRYLSTGKRDRLPSCRSWCD